MSHTCSHIYDTGGICQSFAVKGQRYCVHHLRYRARRLRMAQARARGERFEFNLPPLESLHAVHSALSQLAEAIAHGVIDSRSARDLLSVLRVASRNLLQPEKWQESLYDSEEPAPDVDVAAEYGLPADLDLTLAPDVAFPPHQNSHGVILSGGDAFSASPESKGPFVSAYDGGAPSCSTALAGDPTGGPQLPDVGNCGEVGANESPSTDPFRQLNCMERISPFDVELEEIKRSEGEKAMFRRIDQFERDEQRRKRGAETRAAHRRYSALAFHRNLERLAEKIADEKLARGDSQSPPAKPPASACTESSREVPISQDSTLSPTG